MPARIAAAANPDRHFMEIKTARSPIICLALFTPADPGTLHTPIFHLHYSDLPFMEAERIPLSGSF